MALPMPMLSEFAIADALNHAKMQGRPLDGSYFRCIRF